MNKKFLIVLVMFLPIIIAGIWFFSVEHDSFDSSTVNLVNLVHPDGTSTEYTSEEDKSFFIDFLNNIVSIEKQEYDEKKHSLYKLEFYGISDVESYYLCLSADVRNCLAFDAHSNWYRIDKEYAKQFLVKYDISTVYQNNEVPTMKIMSGTESVYVEATEANWCYLLPDDSYSKLTVEHTGSFESDFFVSAGASFDLSFDVMPDWYGVTIYDGEKLLYDSAIGDFTDFNNSEEARLRAIVKAEWYNEKNSEYYGTATYDFLFDFDVKIVYTIDKSEAYQGDVVYIHLTNVKNETLEITSTMPSAEKLSSHSYAGGEVVIVPIPSHVKAGEYNLTVKSDKSLVSVPLIVKDKGFVMSDISFVGHETVDLYNEAQAEFKVETALANDVVLSEPHWINGLLSPASKFIEGVEQYWPAPPGYGATMRINGTVADERSNGIHYVKGVASESLPMRAVANGTVAFVGKTKLYGNTVIIEHGFGLKSVYGHLGELKQVVGDNVTMGDVIGEANPSCFAINSTEAFFGISVDGVFVNPYNFLVTEVRDSSAPDVSEPIQFMIDLQK